MMSLFALVVFLIYFVKLVLSELEVSTYRYPYFSKISLDFPGLSNNKSHEQTQRTLLRKMEVSDMPPTVLEMHRKYGNCEASYVPLSQEDLDAVFRVLPPALFQLDPKLVIEWQIIEADSFLVPHVDVNRQSSINFYIDTYDAATIFYNNPSNFFRTPQGNNIFDPDWITPQSSFVAQRGDIYLLNVAQIHGVHHLTRGKPRVSITVGLNVPFDDVLPFLTQGVPVAETSPISAPVSLHQQFDEL